MSNSSCTRIRKKYRYRQRYNEKYLAFSLTQPPTRISKKSYVEGRKMVGNRNDEAKVENDESNEKRITFDKGTDRSAERARIVEKSRIDGQRGDKGGRNIRR